jgi:hypothetical protein
VFDWCQHILEKKQMKLELKIEIKQHQKLNSASNFVEKNH